jgi:hypothetical protein
LSANIRHDHFSKRLRVERQSRVSVLAAGNGVITFTSPNLTFVTNCGIKVILTSVAVSPSPSQRLATSNASRH